MTLLKHWSLARGLGRPPSRELDDVETETFLALLALWMHETSPGAGLVKRGRMRRKLIEIYAGRGVDEPEQAARRLLSDASDYAGLLIERRADQYGFMHLTFQDYLAAVALGQLGQQGVGPVVEALASRIGDDNWHEVSLLAIGYIYPRVHAFENLYHAFRHARKGKRGRPEAVAFEFHLEEELVQLQHELAGRTYRLGA